MSMFSNRHYKLPWPAEVADPTQHTVEFAALRINARWADCILPFLILRLVLRPAGLLAYQAQWDWYMAFAVSAVLNALQLTLTGTTIHKALCGIRVTRRHGERPRFMNALMREVHATVLGMAFGVPVLIPLANYLTGRRVLEGRRTAWDRKWHLYSRRSRLIHNIDGAPSLPHRLIALVFVLTEYGLALFFAIWYQPGLLIRGC